MRVSNERRNGEQGVQKARERHERDRGVVMCGERVESESGSCMVERGESKYGFAR